MHLKHVLLTIGTVSSTLEGTQSLSQHLPPFQRFTFAPNNVCINPRNFIASNTVIGQDNLEFTMRNVPGEGDCMFLAVALATSTSMGFGGDYAMLRSIAKECRLVVAEVLSANSGNLYVEGTRAISAKALLRSAARDEDLECEAYIKALENGDLQGGGPELTVLSNILRRPISIYELQWDEENSNDTIPETCQLKCMGSFGAIFRDPLSVIPDPAVISGLKQGAYSWHIHILVVDAGDGEKHACTLLPKECYI